MTNNNNENLYCSYCKEKILLGESYITDPETGKSYHYSKDNLLENCWFPCDEDEDAE